MYIVAIDTTKRPNTNISAATRVCRSACHGSSTHESANKPTTAAVEAGRLQQRSCCACVRGANQPDRATHACNLCNSCCCCSSWCDSPTPGGCRTTVWEGRTHACWHSSQNTGCQHATHVQGDVWGLQSESVWGKSCAAAGRAAHSDTGHWRPTRLLLLRAHAHKPPLRASSLRLPPAATSPRCTANWRCCTAA